MNDTHKKRVKDNLLTLDYLEGTGVISIHKRKLVEELFIFISSGGNGHKSLCAVRKELEWRVALQELKDKVRFLAVDAAYKELDELLEHIPHLLNTGAAHRSGSWTSGAGRTSRPGCSNRPRTSWRSVSALRPRRSHSTSRARTTRNALRARRAWRPYRPWYRAADRTTHRSLHLLIKMAVRPINIHNNWHDPFIA